MPVLVLRARGRSERQERRGEREKGGGKGGRKRGRSAERFGAAARPAASTCHAAKTAKPQQREGEQSRRAKDKRYNTQQRHRGDHWGLWRRWQHALWVSAPCTCRKFCNVRHREKIARFFRKTRAKDRGPSHVGRLRIRKRASSTAVLARN
jgi:hypothetical protein